MFLDYSFGWWFEIVLISLYPITLASCETAYCWKSAHVACCINSSTGFLSGVAALVRCSSFQCPLLADQQCQVLSFIIGEVLFLYWFGRWVWMTITALTWWKGRWFVTLLVLFSGVLLAAGYEVALFNLHPWVSKNCRRGAKWDTWSALGVYLELPFKSGVDRTTD